MIWDKRSFAARNSGKIHAMNEICLVLCTCPDDAVATDLAAGLVEKKLAACVNVLPRVRSIYRWDGEVQDDGESLLLIKTTQSAFEALKDWLRDQHPYDVPEIIALPVTMGSADYLAWVSRETES